MRHRKGKTYIRHGRIEGLDQLLEEISAWPSVQNILPGEIRNSGTGGRGQPLLIRVQRIEAGKLKCVAVRTGRRQDLVLLTNDPTGTAEAIASRPWGAT